MGARIVETRCTKHAKPDFPPHRPGPTYESVWLGYPFNRHEVVHFCNSLLGQKARHEDIRVWQVQLFVPHLIKVRMDLEATALMFVEQAREDCRRIESRKTHEVN